MDRNYTASCYILDFKTNEVLLMYSNKMGKWEPVFGLIKEGESPEEAARRNVYEKSKVQLQFIGNYLDASIYSKDDSGKYFQPFCVERYQLKNKEIIDIQYVAVPLNKCANTDNLMWININNLKLMKNVDYEVTKKVMYLDDLYKDNYKGISLSRKK